MSLLELRSITKEFPGVRALSGVSLDLEQGEVHALCGENGAGKSTLIKIVCGYYPVGTYGGEIILRGAPARFRTLRDAEQHRIALIAQELALVPELSVAENMMLGHEPVRRGLVQWDKVRSEAQRGLAMVGLDLDPETPVKELGIGQQQMVEIAKALLKDAEILVLDEPTAALTERDAQRLLGLIADLRARGVSAFYISHRLEEVFQIADRITVLRDGRSVSTAKTSEMTRPQVIAAMVGREVADLYPRAPAPRDDVALEVEGWSMDDPAIPGRRILDNVSFQVRAGEVLGIAGLMGAGRTALVSSIFGAARARIRGKLRIAGRPGDAPLRYPGDAIAAGLALVSEDRKRYGVVLEASILENITLASLRRLTRRGAINHRAREEEARAQFDALRVRAPGLEALVNQLSGGNQQKVVLGKWLMTSPKILVLDEPTRGIDVGAKAEIYQIIARLASAGLAVILVSSDLPELLGLSHRVVVLNQGQVTATLAHEEATPERVMEAATRKVNA